MAEILWGFRRFYWYRMVERSIRQEDAQREIGEGLQLVRLGIGETVRSELKHAATTGVIGVAWGLLSYGLFGGNIAEKVKNSAVNGARIGAIFGWHASSGDYNEYAKAAGLPISRWYHWLAATLISDRALNEKVPFGDKSRPFRIAITQLFNPISTTGMDRTIRGIRNYVMA